MSPRTKRLFVFCDGTEQDGLVSWEIHEDEEAWLKRQADPNPKVKPLREAARYASNVFRLSRCIAPQTDEGIPQLVLYQSGVGVSDNFEGNNTHRWGAALGAAVASKIRDAYNFIVQNYAPGDQIYLFGFSRGAYTARKVAGLLDGLGLLNRNEMSFFFRYWLNLYKGVHSRPEYGGETRNEVTVEFLGVWDTVGSVRTNASINPAIDILGLQDTSLPACVKKARHAMGYHEERHEFLCTPFAPGADEKRLAQVWFPGVHSDVGGGYKEHQISDLSLLWMAGELEDVGVKIDREYLDTRLSPGAEALEVHHERPADPRDGDRYQILKETMGYPSTFYHRSMWGNLKHVNPTLQGHLDQMANRLKLDSDRMKPLNQLEQECWASRWRYYIVNPLQPHSRGTEAARKPILPPYKEHDAPEEEESPYVLFEEQSLA